MRLSPKGWTGPRTVLKERDICSGVLQPTNLEVGYNV